MVIQGRKHVSRGGYCTRSLCEFTALWLLCSDSPHGHVSPICLWETGCSSLKLEQVTLPKGHSGYTLGVSTRGVVGLVLNHFCAVIHSLVQGAVISLCRANLDVFSVHTFQRKPLRVLL